MTEAMVKVITCDGLAACTAEVRDIIPVGWITFTGDESDRHLCPRCGSKARNIEHQIYYQDMTRITKERGD